MKRFILNLAIVTSVGASADVMPNHCNERNLSYDFITQESLFRSYLIKNGLDADKLEIGYSSNYPEPLMGLIADFKFVTWPIHEALNATGLIRGRDALFDTFGSIVNYGVYRIVCTTTINRFRDTPDLFDLSVRNCVTLANHDVSYFEVRHLDAARAKGCVKQIELSGVQNPTPLNSDASATVSNGRVILNRNDVEMNGCSLSDDEFKNRPRLETEQMNLDYHKLVCE